MSTYDDTQAILTELFRDVFDNDVIELSDGMTAKDVDGWDSVSNITLVLAIEDRFKVRLNVAEIGGLANVGDMIKLLMARSTV